jgi:hypothetical protein
LVARASKALEPRSTPSPSTRSLPRLHPYPLAHAHQPAPVFLFATSQTLLRTDSVAYKMIPVAGYTHVQAELASAPREASSGVWLRMCGWRSQTGVARAASTRQATARVWSVWASRPTARTVLMAPSKAWGGRRTRACVACRPAGAAASTRIGENCLGSPRTFRRLMPFTLSSTHDACACRFAPSS